MERKNEKENLLMRDFREKIPISLTCQWVDNLGGSCFSSGVNQ